ncbi:MAG: glutamine synthetase [Candidatus Thorarchaeota archaeon]|nr:MAG: glutamine synthetase [Candidatus Thorarchaeota archaeon]
MTEPGQKPEFLRLLFTTPLGTTRSVEVRYDTLDEVARDGVYFDGSSIPGYADVNSSDLQLRPATGTPLTEPWDTRAAIQLCSVYEATGEPHPCDPREVLRKVLDEGSKRGLYLKAGPEIEFFLVIVSQDRRISPADQGGYYATRPADGGLELRREMMTSLTGLGIPTTSHHHEVASGQHEIGLAFDSAMEIADRVLLARLAIAEIAYSKGCMATFMPKPFAERNGSGMHIHQSLWDGKGTNLFANELPGTVSEMAHHYVAGIMKHAPALAAIVAPTVNSFKRLRPGFEAPTRIAWGPRNRTTMIRVPEFDGSDEKARIEFRCPDPSCSPHLALAAVMAAGLDGISHGLEPPEPTCEDLYHTEDKTPSLPESLIQALHYLEEDDTLKQALGERIVGSIIKSRTAEWYEYLKTAGKSGVVDITDWEIDKYLRAN